MTVEMLVAILILLGLLFLWMNAHPGPPWRRDD